MVGKNGYDFRKPDAKARAFEDQDYLDAVGARRTAIEYRKRVAALYAGLERDLFVVSRDLSRRTGIASQGDRAGRLGA